MSTKKDKKSGTVRSVLTKRKSGRKKEFDDITNGNPLFNKNSTGGRKKRASTIRSRNTISSTDKVEHDFGELLANNLKEDDLENLFFFPNDDVKAYSIQREMRVNIEQELEEVKLNHRLPHFRSCYDIFTKSWKGFARGYKYNYQLPTGELDMPIYEKGKNLTWKYIVDNLNSDFEMEFQKYNMEYVSGGSETTLVDNSVDDLLFDFVDNNVEDTLDEKSHIFRMCDWKLPEKEIEPELIELKTRDNILIRVKTVNFDAGNLEPYYGVMFLYNIGTGIKMSENFHFIPNPDIHEAFFNIPSPYQPSALFTVSHPSPDLVLIVKIYKLFQGDPEDYLPLYAKGTLKDKEIQKITGHITQHQNNSHADTKLQAICWGMIPIYGEENELFINENSKISNLHRIKMELSDSEFLDHLGEVSGTKKFKTIGGEIWISGTMYNKDDPLPVLTTSNYLVNSEDTRISEYVHEIKEFLVGPPLSPNIEFRNNLYIYLDTVNLGKISSKNIQVTVELMPSDHSSEEPVEAFYDKQNPFKLNTIGKTVVYYNTKTATFNDELKIRLPLQISTRYNLKFTISHISSKGKGESETIIGYTYFPVIVEGFINTVEQTLPIFSALPDRYLSGKSHTVLQQNLVDNPKKTFLKYRVGLDSTVFSSDDRLSSYLHSLRKEPDVILQTYPIVGTSDAKEQFLWFPVLMGLLLGDLQTPELQHGAFECIVGVLIKSHLSKTLFLDLMKSYLAYSAVNHMGGEVPVYINLINAWSDFLTGEKELTNNSDKMSKISWFLLQIIYISMCTELKREKKFELDKKARFPSRVILILRNFIHHLTQEIRDTFAIELVKGNEMKKSLIEFFFNLFSILDTGIVVDMIKRSISTFQMLGVGSSESQAINTSVFVTEFIDDICAYEHFTQVNLPFSINMETIDYDNFTKIEGSNFFTDLVVQNIRRNSTNSDFLARSKSIKVLLNVLGRYDYDTRFQSEQEIVQVHYPFFQFVLYVVKNVRNKAFEFAHKKDLYLSYLHILDRVDPNLLEHWWLNDTKERISDFMDTLKDAIYIFQLRPQEEYEKKIAEGQQKSSTAKAALESFYTDPSWGSGTGTTGRKLTLREQRALQKQQGQMKSNTLGSTGDESSSTGNNNKKSWTSRRQADFQEINISFIFDEKRESLIFTQTSLILIKLLKRFISVKENELIYAPKPNVLLMKLFQVVNSLLIVKQDISTLEKSFSLLKEIILKFGKNLFGPKTYFLDKLCEILIVLCNFKNTTVRTRASALVYLLIKKNYEFSKTHFAGVSSQLTIVLSELVTDIKDTTYVEISLETVRMYAKTENLSPDFVVKVVELSQRLETILVDMKLINDYPDDPVMQADLYVRIADSYKSNVSLRTTSLQALARIQVENTNLTEAAHCHIHIAAIISEYLAMVEYDEDLPSGASAFSKLSTSAGAESIPNTDKEYLQSLSEIFTEDSLINSLSLAASLLVQSEQNDSLNLVYKILIPIYEKRNEYVMLSKVHGNLQSAYIKILEQVNSGKRFFGSYYRVAFHGNAFREMDGKEYIYKERSLTKLGEITLRLKGYYENKFSSSINLHIWKESRSMKREELEDLTTNCYIQITSVDPYLEKWELRERKTEFEKSTNIDRFIYSMPFTKSGLGQTEDVSQQYQLKTILSTVGTFPNLTTRMEVIEHNSIELTPLQNSLELIEGRILKMNEILSAEDINSKVLQPVLTGSVSAIVHAGPMAICKAFFDSQTPLSEQYTPSDLANLKRALLEFIEICKKGLDRNQEIITQNEVAFHEQMLSDYAEMRSTMHSLLL